MLKSIIDQLRAHRDRLDAAITELEAVEADELEPWHGMGRTYGPRRKVTPIVLGSKTTARTCGRPGCGKTLGPNNTSGYCGKHWYETIRKRPLVVGQKRVGRPGSRSAKERHEMSLRMKRMWAEGRFKGRESKGKKVT